MLHSPRICGIDLVGEENSAVGRICLEPRMKEWVKMRAVDIEDDVDLLV